ncbi:MAG: peptidase T [Clostridia bacterium]|nr:peptidase T [Clostridia bacterium]
MTVSERFLKYVCIPTMSDEKSETVPSTEKQKVLGAALVEEMTEMGLSNVRMDAYGYVYGTLPANTKKNVAPMGLIAHMDTSSAAADDPIRPSIVEYKGGDVVLNAESGLVLSPKDYPALNGYVGQRLIVTDGTTLLGADDKAGVAEIMSAVEALIQSGAEHGDVHVGFTPDEEIGRGADHFDVAGFGAAYAYTVDGGALGELEYENFNAASAKVTVHGISIHPGSAKDKMKNAVSVAMEFDSLLPKMDVPEKTEGYEGFHHICEICGDIELATAAYIIRDHDRAKFEMRKDYFRRAADEINRRYGAETLTLTLRDSYYNMKEIIEQNSYTVDRAVRAMKNVGIEPRIVPIRGGTDGARLSFMGLPCPNLCTGGENFHSRFEYISIDSMEKITEMLVRLMTSDEA